MDALSPDERIALEKYSKEHLISSELSEEFIQEISSAISAVTNFLNRADISWEISTPVHRVKGAPLARHGTKVYSGKHVLYDICDLSEYDRAFLKYVLDKNKVGVVLE